MDSETSVGRTSNVGPTIEAHVILAIVAVALVILYYLYPNPVPDLRSDQAHDSFEYIRLAKQLLRGQGFLTKHWQPGFPVMLAGGIALVGLDFYRLKLAMIGLGLATALVSARLFNRAGYAQAAPFLATLLAATPIYFDYSHRLMSEIPFTACSTIALAALLELLQASARRTQIVAATVLMLAVPSAVLIRGNGVALAPAIATALFLSRGPGRRQVRQWLAASLVLLVITFSGWMFWGKFHQFSGINNVTYLDEVQASDVKALWNAGGYGEGVARISPMGLLRRIYQNVAWYQAYHTVALIWPFAEQLSEVRKRPVGLLLASAGLIPAIIGVVVLAYRSPPLFAWLLCSLFVVISYPTGGAPRMLLPVIPVLILAFYAGLEFLIGRRAAVGWVMCALTASLFACAIQADFQSRHPYFGNPYGDSDSAADAVELILVTIPKMTPRNALVIGDYFQIVRALTDRASGSRAGLDTYLTDADVYVLETRSRPIALPPGVTRQVIASRGDAELSAVRRIP